MENTRSPIRDTKVLFLLFFCFFFFYHWHSQDNLQQHKQKGCRKNQLGSRYKWTDMEMKDLYKFFGLLIYMSLVSLPRLQDYRRQNHILSVLLPAKVMTRDRFRSILRNIHLSDPEEDAQNDSKKGTTGDKSQTVQSGLFMMTSSAPARHITTWGESWRWMEGWWQLRWKRAWHSTWRTSRLIGL